MSEESDKQSPVEAKPKPARRRRPPRRTLRAKNETASHTGEGDVPTAAPENEESHVPADRVRAAAREMISEPGTNSQSETDAATDEAPQIAGSAMTDKMQLASAEESATVPSADAAASPPQNERHFRDRERDRDRSHQGLSSTNGEQMQREPEFGEGVIEISGKGFGFLRDAKRNFVQTPQDIFVTPEIVRRFGLRDGMWIQGETRRGNRGPQLMRLNKINDDEPTKYQGLTAFEELTTINPNKRINLETVPDRYTTRIMDLMTPLGMGQRGLIVAPPRTGKTTLLHHIADAVTKNHPETVSYTHLTLPTTPYV